MAHNLARRVHQIALQLGQSYFNTETTLLWEETIGISKKLYKHDPKSYQSGLAKSLHSYALYLRRAGRFDLAGPTAKEAVILRRQLYRAQPESIWCCSDLAESLQIYTVILHYLDKTDNTRGVENELENNTPDSNLLPRQNGPDSRDGIDTLNLEELIAFVSNSEVKSLLWRQILNTTMSGSSTQDDASPVTSEPYESSEDPPPLDITSTSFISLPPTLFMVSNEWGLEDQSGMQLYTLCDRIAGCHSLQRMQIITTESYTSRGRLSRYGFLILELRGSNGLGSYLRLERRPKKRLTRRATLSLNGGEGVVEEEDLVSVYSI